VAFTTNTKQQIHDRAASQSELSGCNETPTPDNPLECAHLDHDKSLPEYNWPDMGVLCTDVEHYTYHLLFRLNPEEIGLTRNQNDWAIKMCYLRCIHNGSPVTKQTVAQAKAYWFYHLGIEG
jgi:hypothetical protein